MIKIGISKKKFISTIFLFSVITFSCGYAIQNIPFNRHQPMGQIANVFFTIESPMEIYDISTSNLITDIGEQQACTRFMTNGTYVHVGFISLSNDATPLASWTKLPNEATTLGAKRVEGTVSAMWYYPYGSSSTTGDASHNVTAKFTFTGDITLQCAGGNWAYTSESDNNLYSAAAFPQTAFANNWNLTITWVYVFNGN